MMAGESSIEWTDATWNPVRGCTRVSEGCRNCYAERFAARFAGPGLPYEGLAKGAGALARWTGKLTFGHDLDAPLRWRRPRRIFVNSMSDLFHEGLADHEIATVFAIAVAAHHLHGHTFQILTKRAPRMRATLTSEAFWEQVNDEAGMNVLERVDALARRSDDARATLDDYGPDNAPPGLWLGVSCEDQPTADARIPYLSATPAAIRFVSAEPMIGPIDFRNISGPEDEFGTPFYSALTGLGGRRYRPININRAPDMPPKTNALDWIIVGGESGPHARAMHPAWVRSIRDQCAAAGVAFFFKQWGEWLPGAQYSDKCRAADPSDTESRFACMDWNGERYEEASSFWADDPSEHAVYRVGKKLAGRLMDGVEHNGAPVPEMEPVTA